MMTRLSRWIVPAVLLLLPLSSFAAVAVNDGSDLWQIDPTSNAGRVTPYDNSGNVLAPADKGALGVLSGGQTLSGKDYKLGRTIRGSSTGGLATADDQLITYDSFEGTTRNLNVWTETATTQTSAQAVATGLTLNTASTTTTTTGIIESSNRLIQFMGRSPVVARFHLNYKGATNCFEEWGFSDQSSATVALHNNGAFFRRDGSGTVQPVLAFNGGTEAQGTSMTAPATTEYAWYEILLEESRATFAIYSHTGTLLSSQVMEIGTTGAGAAGDPTRARFFTNTHLPVFLRTLNVGAAGTAPQILVNHVAVYSLDTSTSKPWSHTMSGIGYNSLVNPTTYLQTANYANSAAPASATLSNTAAGYTTLGGQYQFAAQATNETDFALFGWTNPSPYTFYCTGIRIGEMINTVAVVTTTPSVYHWGAGFNSSAVSLATAAPYSPMKVQLGVQGFPTSAINTTLGAIGAVAPGFSWTPGTPMAVYPGKFLHIILKQMLGSATATEIFRGAVTVDGYFE